MRARGFIVQKACEQIADCQDRFSINAATGSVAVCDGMSQSLFPKYWAEIIAEQYTSDLEWIPSHHNVTALAPRWRERVERRLENLKAKGIDPWRSESMLARGCSAGSTLVGVRTDGSFWRCDVLGDSCLVVIKGDKIENIHSSMSTDHFDNYPDYFDSNPDRSGKGSVETCFGKWEGNMILILVSDPLAGFLSSIRGTEKESTYIGELLNVESTDEFSILVEYWREEGMHNDDTTMLVLTDEYHQDEGAFKRQEECVW